MTSVAQFGALDTNLLSKKHISATMKKLQEEKEQNS